jgi:hypothetical protein
MNTLKKAVANGKWRSLLVALAAGAISLSGVSPAFAKKYSPLEFREALKITIGSSKGASAYNKAARFFQKAIGDRKNKKYARQYAQAVVKAMRGGTVSTSLLGRATNTLTKGLIAGYFKGVPYDLNDAGFNKAFKILLRGIPLSQKTAATSQMIYNTLKTYSARKGVSQDDVFAYYQTVDVANRLPQPVS